MVPDGGCVVRFLVIGALLSSLVGPGLGVRVREKPSRDARKVDRVFSYGSILYFIGSIRNCNYCSSH